MSVTGKTTKETIESIDIVSDDMTQVMVLERDGEDLRIKIRESTGSRWDAKPFTRLSGREQNAISVIFGGGQISSWQRSYLEDVSDQSFSLPKPETVEPDATGDCTPLDIERAKAANLKEQREIIELEMERDHALDRHVTGDVPGCPACDRKYIPRSRADDMGGDEDGQPGTTGDLDTDDIPF